MKTKLFLSVLLSFSFYLLSSQVPQGFNYQAIARDVSGNPITGATIKVKLSILTDTVGFGADIGGTYIWEEEHTGVVTNAYGLFTIVLGNPLATRVRGVASFDLINWNQPKLYLGTKIANPSTYKVLGGAKLWSVPYAMISDNLSGPVKKLAIKSLNTSPDSAIFEVKNNLGQTVFAVYNEGVRVYVDDGIGKGITKGGFAIGGFGTDKGGVSQRYFMVKPDSIRMYIDDTGKGITKGGFAIGGFGTDKAPPKNLFIVNPDSIRAYIDTTYIGKGITKGGFAIGGFGTEKGLAPKYLSINANRANISVNDSIAGFSLTNVQGGASAGFMNINKVNYFIGHESGINTVPGSGFIGKYNSFLGYQSGLSNITGRNNVFLGYKSGLTNNASYNVFVGNETGIKNSDGGYNTFLGYRSGFTNVGGDGNVFLGFQAGGLNTEGSNNIFVGYNTGYNNTTASGNFFAGYNAGLMNKTGEFNLYLGYQAGRSSTAGTSNICIGYRAGYAEMGSNKLYITNTDLKLPLIFGDLLGQRVVIKGDSTHNVNKRNFFVNGTAGGTSGWFNDSDKRLKTDIETIADPLKKVLALRGVNFYWKDKKNRGDGPQIGFIAQEAVNVIPEVVGHEGDRYDMQYSPITALLVEAIKKQQEIIEKQSVRMTQIEEANKMMIEKIEILAKELNEIRNNK